MTISDILTADRVVAELRGNSKEEILQEFATLLAKHVPGVDAATVVTVLRERERLNSTAIGEGVAIPHGRLAGLRNVVAGFGRSPRGVDFESVDRQPTHLFFVLIAPDDAAAMHLKALARISRLMKDKSFRERLLGLNSREALYQAIVSEDAKY